ncbi:MAG: trypsin-like peptidase domain-containing protein [Anaerolineales bacterium]|nr:trypsin-like peptidase domain-containing protein [Anaerolineales bacterium]
MIRLSVNRAILLTALVALVTLSCSFSLPARQTIEAITPKDNTPTPIVATPVVASAPIQLPALVTNEEAVLIELYKQVNPAVVNIITYADQGNFVTSAGQGSGFVYDSEGHIITNSHVVHGADAVEVVFSDNTTLAAEIVGEDLHSDLAVIKVANLPEGVRPLPLGDMNQVAVGQTVVAIGNPFGLGGTLTRGIVSALGRTIPALTAFSIPQAIQTDAPINPGNSGGPLLNLRGEVIGVNAQIETADGTRANSGVGFAIPVSIVSKVVPVLIRDGKYEWSWMGVVGGSLSPTLVEAMKLPVNKGAYVAEVVAGGPAEKAGLRGASRQTTFNGRRVAIGGDVIIAVNGQPVTAFEDILIYLAMNTIPGQKITLTIIRDGKQMEVEITLGPRPNEERQFFQP